MDSDGEIWCGMVMVVGCQLSIQPAQSPYQSISLLYLGFLLYEHRDMVGGNHQSVVIELLLSLSSVLYDLLEDVHRGILVREQARWQSDPPNIS